MTKKTLLSMLALAAIAPQTACAHDPAEAPIAAAGDPTVTDGADPVRRVHPGADPALSDADQIMAYEKEIYTRRGLGDIDYYASLIHPNYMGWPPMMNGPVKGETFPAEASAEVTARLMGEKIDFYPMGITFADNMAMAYFVGHRIVAGGTREPVDEYFDNIHVWVKEDDGLWYLMGGMARPMAPASRDFLLEAPGE